MSKELNTIIKEFEVLGYGVSDLNSESIVLEKITYDESLPWESTKRVIGCDFENLFYEIWEKYDPSTRNTSKKIKYFENLTPTKEEKQLIKKLYNLNK